MIQLSFYVQWIVMYCLREHHFIECLLIIQLKIEVISIINNFHNWYFIFNKMIAGSNSNRKSNSHFIEIANIIINSTNQCQMMPHLHPQYSSVSSIGVGGGVRIGFLAKQKFSEQLVLSICELLESERINTETSQNSFYR